MEKLSLLGENFKEKKIFSGKHYLLRRYMCIVDCGLYVVVKLDIYYKVCIEWICFLDKI